MTPQYHEQITRLKRGMTYTIEDIFNAVQRAKEGDEASKELVHRYYYPIALEKAYAFFKGDEEGANDAAFLALDHMVGESAAIFKFGGDVGQLSAFVNAVFTNFFTKYYHRKWLKEPEIIYGNEQEQDAEDYYGDGDEVENIEQVDHNQHIDDYPYDGTDQSDPETLAIKKEEDQGQANRLEEIRALLYPGDIPVYELLLENFNSDEIANILERTVVAIENSLRRIRTALDTVNG